MFVRTLGGKVIDKYPVEDFSITTEYKHSDEFHVGVPSLSGVFTVRGGPWARRFVLRAMEPFRKDVTSSAVEPGMAAIIFDNGSYVIWVNNVLVISVQTDLRDADYPRRYEFVASDYRAVDGRWSADFDCDDGMAALVEMAEAVERERIAEEVLNG